MKDTNHEGKSDGDRINFFNGPQENETTQLDESEEMNSA